MYRLELRASIWSYALLFGAAPLLFGVESEFSELLFCIWSCAIFWECQCCYLELFFLFGVAHLSFGVASACLELRVFIWSCAFIVWSCSRISKLPPDMCALPGRHGSKYFVFVGACPLSPWTLRLSGAPPCLTNYISASCLKGLCAKLCGGVAASSHGSHTSVPSEKVGA